MKPPVIFIVGPTAVGKSRIGLEIARHFNGEIISADSMLVYRGMDIGTAKPTSAEQQEISHHLIDIINPSQKFSVFQYYKKARRLIAQITKRGKLPIVVGGTGLYVRALLQGLEPLPPANIKLRKRLQLQAQTSAGLKKIYAQLLKKCPERAAKIKPTDERRVIRALEVLAERKKMSIRGERPRALRDLGFNPVVIGITWDRQRLYSEIERRVELMFQQGLVDEVKTLLKNKLSQTAAQAVGYKEIISALRGECTIEQAKDLVKRNTRHLAKRQWTWFRREEGIQWVDRDDLSAVFSLLRKGVLGNSI